MPGTSTIDGLASGLDTGSIVEKLMQLEHRPVDIIEQRQEQKQEKLSAWQEINTKLLALKSAAEALNDVSNYGAKTATVSDDTVLEVTVDSTAPSGSYTFTVESMAKNHQMVSNIYSTSISRVGVGTITFTLASGDSETIELTDDNNTLSQLRDAINNMGIGIKAAVLNTGEDAYRLYVYSVDSGSKNQITVSSNLTAPPNTGDVVIGFTDIQSASDAVIKMGLNDDAITVTGESNTFRNVIPGLTITLKEEDPSTQVYVTVTEDASGVKDLISDFVKKYNDVMAYISEQNTYNQDDGKGGVLMGDSTLLMIQRNLQDLVMNPVSGQPDDMKYLFQLSISTTKEGTLTINDEGLNTLVNQRLEDVESLFINGIANSVKSELYDVTNPVFGIISDVEDSLRQEISDMTNQIKLMEERLMIRKEQLYKQFTQMETALNLYQGQSSYLTTQFRNLDKNWKSS